MIDADGVQKCLNIKCMHPQLPKLEVGSPASNSTLHIPCFCPHWIQPSLPMWTSFMDVV